MKFSQISVEKRKRLKQQLLVSRWFEMSWGWTAYGLVQHRLQIRFVPGRERAARVGGQIQHQISCGMI